MHVNQREPLQNSFFSNNRIYCIGTSIKKIGLVLMDNDNKMTLTGIYYSISLS